MKKILLKIKDFLYIIENSSFTYYLIFFFVVLSFVLFFSANKIQSLNKDTFKNIENIKISLQEKNNNKNDINIKFENMSVEKDIEDMKKNIGENWEIDTEIKNEFGYKYYHVCSTWLKENPLQYDMLKKIKLDENIKIEHIVLSHEKSEFCINYLANN